MQCAMHGAAVRRRWTGISRSLPCPCAALRVHSFAALYQTVLQTYCRYALESSQPWGMTAGGRTTGASSAGQGSSSGAATTAALPRPGAGPLGTQSNGKGGAGSKAGALITGLGGSFTERAREAGAHVRGMRPSLLDACYGLDLALPGTAGVGRLVAWYSPGRGEGMVELRLF